MELLKGVRADGTVDDTLTETHWRPLTAIETAQGFMRLRADDGATDIEIRLPYVILENMGWTRADGAPDGCSDIHSQIELLLSAPAAAVAEGEDHNV
jgi:hypothetical protein